MMVGAGWQWIPISVLIGTPQATEETLLYA